METAIESWRKVWREGVKPLLSVAHLEALHKALATDDVRLLQGATTNPPLMTVADWDMEGACLIALCGWQGDGLRSVGEVEEFFARMCFQIDEAMGEPAACRFLLSWFDETPRAEMIALLLPEVKMSLVEKTCAN